MANFSINELKSLPNLITSIRFFLAPFLVYLAYMQELLLFTIFFYICGVSDYIDGPIARRYNLATELGSMLDSFADELLLLLGLVFIYLFRSEILLDNILLFGIFLSVYATERVLLYALHKGKTRLHLYSGKAFARSFYIFLPIMFYVNNYSPMMYLILTLGFITFIEHSIIYIKYKDIDPEIKTIVKSKYNILSYLSKSPF